MAAGLINPKQKNSPAAICAAIASHKAHNKNVRRRELGDHRVPAIDRVAAFAGTAPFPSQASGSTVAARTETAYRLEASNFSIPLQRLETIGPMLIRNVADDFALARAP